MRTFLALDQRSDEFVILALRSTPWTDYFLNDLPPRLNFFLLVYVSDITLLLILVYR